MALVAISGCASGGAAPSYSSLGPGGNAAGIQQWNQPSFGGGLNQWSVKRNARGNIVRNGSYTLSHPNGKKAFEGTYRNGKLHGTFRYWDPSGNLISQGRFRNGELIED